MSKYKKRLLFYITLLFIFIFLTQSIVLSDLSGEIIVNVDKLNVRSGPSLDDNVISQINKNEKYPIIEEKNNWYKISFNNEEGWVASWLVDELKSTDKLAKTLESETSTLNVRSGPSQNFSVIDQIHPGSKYLIIEEEGDWIKIQLNTSKTGWVANWFVNVTDGIPSNETTEIELATIAANILNVRSGPSTADSIIGQLYEGDKIEIINVDKTWYKINFDDSYGWIASKYTDKVSSTENPSSVAKMIGKKVYVSTNSLNLREGPSLNNNVISNIYENDTLVISDTDGDWLKVSLESNSNISGWVSSEYVSASKSVISNEPTVTILNPGTNLREGPTTSDNVVSIANSGDEFPIIATNGDWYEILLPNGKNAFVAGWIVSVKGIEQEINHGLNNFLENKVIVVDAGHGGKDQGATGTSFSTLEKILNLEVAKILQSKLEASGATVIMTRTTDTYLTLQQRVDISIINDADAFISIHHNTNNDSSINGTITYYYYDYSKELAQDVHSSLVQSIELNDMNTRNERFFVLRENPNPAILIELGFLTNYQDELKVNSEKFQENAAEGIFQGLLNYFK